MSNNDKKEIEIIVKKPSRKELRDFPERRTPTLNTPIINPFKLWREEFGETKKEAFLSGFIQGLTFSRRKNKKIQRIDNELFSPPENFLGNFNDDLIETKKEAFVLGFIQGIGK